MIVLGLHFGHDAGAAVLDGGRLRACVVRERHTRVKHALGLDRALVDRALADAGIEAAAVDLCAITSTQGVELLGDAGLSVEHARHPAHAAPCALADELAAAGRTIHDRLVFSVLDSLYGTPAGAWLPAVWATMFPAHRGRARGDFVATGCIDTFVMEPAWARGATLAELRSRRVELRDDLRIGFHHPAVVQLGDRQIPAYFVHHHLAHAASSYYSSGFDDAAIVTHDGYSDGAGYHAGMFYLGRGHRIYPLSPHHLALGALYDRVGLSLGLSTLGPAGKLMGLAAYGRPEFFDRKFVGNHYDHRGRFRSDPVSAWLYHCVSRARRDGYDMEPHGDPRHATARINADIAASTQLLFEEIRGEAVSVLRDMLRGSGLATDHLCLSGGTALNCPSNTRIAAEAGFACVWIEPACDDGGLAAGAARAVYHSVLDHPRVTGAVAMDAYVGVRHDEAELVRALAALGDRVAWSRGMAPGAEAARDLVADRVIGWFEGRSELGPRALGHRSILADPRRAANWPRVNRIKGREPWRPLAPAVLAEEAARWFSGVPLPSPYMLFNARVVSDRIPAVTHVDGTARIQTVDARCGGYRSVIEEFFRLTDVPVVLNTSLNGRGEPLVETPADALQLLLRTELDVAYLDGYRVTRNEARR